MAQEERLACYHVYNVIGKPTCPECGRDTHETDFQEIARLRKQWIDEGKADWSICKECGGTIRGWWSI